MRIDKFLKNARIIKRRTVANEACDAGKVSVNGKVVKAGFCLSAGDIIEVDFGSKKAKVRVIDVKDHVKKDDACNMYEIIN